MYQMQGAKVSMPSSDATRGWLLAAFPQKRLRPTDQQGTLGRLCGPFLFSRSIMRDLCHE